MLETILIIIFCIVFGIPVFTNTVGPFIIWKTQKLPAKVKFQSIGDDVFIEERNHEFLRYDQAIKNLGFDVIGSSLLEDSHSESYFRLYWNSEIKVTAMVVTMKSKVEEFTYIEYTQRYSDGRVLDVSNSSRPEAYPNLEFKHAYRYPEKSDAAELLSVHRKLSEAFLKNVTAANYDLSRGFGEVEDFLKRESDALVHKKIVKPEIDLEGKRSLTLLGAIALTYRSVPPGKNIWGYISEKRAKKALRNV